MHSSLQPGSSLTMEAQLSKRLHLTITETVTVVEPCHQLAVEWGADVPCGDHPTPSLRMK
jgi:hypothetical protein